MKLSDVNELVQTGAAVVAILGILLLGYELRQSNALATQQAVSQSWSTWIGFRESTLESGISTVIEKAITKPDSLTLAEELALTNYYFGLIDLYTSDFEVFAYTDQAIVTAEVEEAAQYLAINFSYPYARAWLREIGQYELSTELLSTLTTELEGMSGDFLESSFARVKADANRQE